MDLEVLPNPVIVYDSEWKISKINASAVQQLGYTTAEELIGRSIRSIVPANESQIAKHLSRILQKEEKGFFVQLIEHLGNNGKTVKLISKFSILEHVQDHVTFRYIESGFLLDEALEQNERQLNKLHYYKILAENVPGLMMLLVNKSMEIQCSVGDERWKRKKFSVHSETTNLLNRLPQSIIDVLLPLLEIAFDGTSVSREFNHGTHFYSVQLTPLLDYENQNLCVIILQNITETKIVENKLKLSKEEAEAANKAKSNFVAQMSHEIRTPLNAIIGFTDQLGRTKLSKKQSSYMDVVKNSSQHLLSLIDDILILSKIEAGQIEVEDEPFRLSEVINAVTDVLEVRQKKKNLDFQIHSDLSLDEVLCGDPAKLRQVLINLLNNALKFTQKGSVTLGCSTISASLEELTLLFEITDTGIGIAPENFERIFNPFQQGDGSISRNYFGSGLGLTISKNLVESMGGSISVKSRLGEGSTFSFSLTFKRPTKPYNQIRNKKTSLPRISLSHVNVLFVDDDPANRLLGSVILSNNKIKGDFASSGEEAIKLFIPGRYHLVFLDINMPGTSGIDVALHFRNIESKFKNHRPSVIIAMTANVLRRHIEQYIQAGMDDVILKPFKEDEFYEKILIHSNNTDDAASCVHASIPKLKGASEFDLSELFKIAKGNTEFIILMFNTFLDNGETLLQKIKKSFADNDYQSIAEAAHRLAPAFEQLGFIEATSLLKAIENRYLRNVSSHDPVLIENAMSKIEAGIAVIRKARNEMR
ncbi:MAG: response regulator [Bacteroidales bacterium]|nr:response regulator [Bacteroidales bacterium]